MTTPAAPQPPRRRFNPWKWLSVLVILVAAIPNVTLILIARRAGISKVEEQPWQSAARLDAQAQAQTAFAASGGRLEVQPGGDGIRCSLLGTVAGPVRVSCYRPSDAALDRSAPWPDPAVPLAIPLPAGGRWVVRLLDADGLILASAAVELPIRSP